MEQDKELREAAIEQAKRDYETDSKEFDDVIDHMVIFAKSSIVKEYHAASKAKTLEEVGVILTINKNSGYFKYYNESESELLLPTTFTPDQLRAIALHIEQNQNK